MQVITLDRNGLDAAAEQLARAVAGDGRQAKAVVGDGQLTRAVAGDGQLTRDGGAGRFDAIIGIRRGGSFVCDAFCKVFPEALYGARYDITLQRPSTKRKGGVTGAVLRCLPMKVLDMLRIAESRVLSFFNRHRKGRRLPEVVMEAGLTEILSHTAQPRVLIIDDAIDSGTTMAAVVSALKKLNPDVGVTTAVITVTTSDPAVTADFTIYRNRTLIRFPWSNDYRQAPKA